jgi:hypothetical protein
LKVNVVNPHASVLIWNYVDRADSSGATPNANVTEEQVIVGTSSIISITTSKRKSSPAGSFEIKLAPRFNWVARITPGSWCAILMSQTPIQEMSKNKVGHAKKESFKMLGRIDSVRGVVEVDQVTGARRTIYVVSGQDWGSVFDSLVYIDPIMANNVWADDPIAQTNTILALNMYASYAADKQLPSSSDLIESLKKLWGAGATGTDSQGGLPITSSLLLGTKTQFRLPTAVANFMKQGGMGAIPGANSIPEGISPTSTAYNFADIIKIYHGKLKGLDRYSGDLKESFGLPNPHNFFGQHSFWQLLTELSNNALNEMVTDIRWEGDNPKFALYHRIRPFVNNPSFIETALAGNSKNADAQQAKTVVEANMSLFKNVKRSTIPVDDVISINFGTNWRDKINFIEITPTSQLLAGREDQAIIAKKDGQTYDPIGYERDGFKPLRIQSAFLPYADGSTPMIQNLTYWKWLIREWHFNSHILLNGSLTFVGQNQYIQVGDNVMVDSKILGEAPTNAGQKRAKSDSFLLAHVENIMHSFSVNQETGARSFATTVQFVRGVITDKSGVSLAIPGSNAIDKSASSLTDQDIRNKSTFGTSVESDPDIEKLNKNGLL